MTAQPLDHRVQVGSLLGRNDLRAGCRKRQLVGRPVLHERDSDHDHEHRNEPDVQHLEEHDGEEDVEEPEHGARQHDPEREPCVAAERLALHGSHGSDGR